jgi:hypothetical protein
VSRPPANAEVKGPLAAVLDERVRDAARILAHTAARLVAEPAPEGGASTAIPVLRDALTAVAENCAFADLHAGRRIEDIAKDLGLSMAAARRRYDGRQVPGVPLLVALAEWNEPP